MKYYVFLLTAAESVDGNKKGFGYAYQNKSRWVEITRADEFFTYERGVTHIVKDNQVYHIFKDYINLDENYRVLICEIKGLQSDDINISVL